MSGQTHEFIIYAMLQLTRGDNLTICYRKKQVTIGVAKAFVGIRPIMLVVIAKSGKD